MKDLEKLSRSELVDLVRSQTIKGLKRKELMKLIGEILEITTSHKNESGEQVEILDREFVSDSGSQFSQKGLQHLYMFLVDDCGQEEPIEMKQKLLSNNNSRPRIDQKESLKKEVKYSDYSIGGKEIEEILKGLKTEVDQVIEHHDFTTLDEFLSKLEFEEFHKVVYSWLRNGAGGGRPIKYHEVDLFRAVLYKRIKDISERELAAELARDSKLSENLGFENSVPTHNTFSTFFERKLSTQFRKDQFINIYVDISDYIDQQLDESIKYEDFVCPDCGEEIDSIRGFEGHTKKPGHKSFTDYLKSEDGYICPKCLEPIQDREGLSSHFNTKHQNSMSYYYYHNFDDFQSAPERYRKQKKASENTDSDTQDEKTEEFGLDIPPEKLQKAATDTESLESSSSLMDVCLLCGAYFRTKNKTKEHHRDEEHDAWIQISSVPEEWVKQDTINNLVEKQIREQKQDTTSLDEVK